MVHEIDGVRFQPAALPPGRTAVMFTADWCGHCRRFLPHFKRLQDAWLVDISDEDVPVWDDYSIHVVPTIVVFQDGAEVRRWTGVLREPVVAEVEATLRA